MQNPPELKSYSATQDTRAFRRPWQGLGGMQTQQVCRQQTTWTLELRAHNQAASAAVRRAATCEGTSLRRNRQKFGPFALESGQDGLGM
jgi:hypothetical protein